MHRVTRDSLLTLEAYAKARQEFRARVMAHKKNRAVHLGKNVTLIFEDELTIRYQIQEMLRVEKIFDEGGIQDELDAYNPLVPDGANWKATMLIEFPDPAERAAKLRELIGIEGRVWVRIEGCDPVYAVADEDMERETESLRHNCASLSMGISHPAYGVPPEPVTQAVRDSLMNDLSTNPASQ
jgi:hypothetical protein